MNRRAQLVCVWSGPLLTVLFAIGCVFLGRFIPPDYAPSDSAQEIAAAFSHNTDQIRVGLFLMMIAMSLIAPWGVAIAAQTRPREGSFPVLTYLQIACVAIGTVIVVAMCAFWAVAAFRPGAAAPEVTRHRLRERSALVRAGLRVRPRVRRRQGPRVRRQAHLRTGPNGKRLLHVLLHAHRGALSCTC